MDKSWSAIRGRGLEVIEPQHSITSGSRAWGRTGRSLAGSGVEGSKTTSPQRALGVLLALNFLLQTIPCFAAEIASNHGFAALKLVVTPLPEQWSDFGGC